MKVGKLVTIIARQPSMSHSITSRTLKNKNKMMAAVKASASSKAKRLPKLREGPVLDAEKHRMAWIEDQTRKLFSLAPRQS